MKRTDRHLGLEVKQRAQALIQADQALLVLDRDQDQGDDDEDEDEENDDTITKRAKVIAVVTTNPILVRREVDREVAEAAVLVVDRGRLGLDRGQPLDAGVIVPDLDLLHRQL